MKSIIIHAHYNFNLTLDDVNDNKYCIDLPEELKYVLVNDWDLVVHQKHLFKLPAKVSLIRIYYNLVSDNNEMILGYSE